MRFLALFLLAGSSLWAEVSFSTGQAARLVVGQTTFTAQDYGASSSLLGAVSGVAYTGDMLFVADGNRLSALPQNQRVLIFRNLSQQLPAPLAEIPQSADDQCPACRGEATVVLGQTSFEVDPEEALKPTAADSFRTPVGVHSDGIRVAVADTDNNRVLIWNSIPSVNGKAADVVLGQKDFTSNLSTGFNPRADSLRGPQGVWLQDNRLFVADTGNNRVLIWDPVPTQNGQPADLVLGQKDFTSFVQPDLTKAELEPKANTMLTPVSVTSDGRRLFVTDLGHNRVLIWNAIPSTNQQAADIVIGQPDMESAIANNSRALCDPIPQEKTEGGEEPAEIFPLRCAATLNFPRFALSDGQRLFIADGGNDRVLVFNSLPSQNGARADAVLGQLSDQLNLTSDSAFPEDVAAAGVIRTPSALAWDGVNLYVTDPFNRRVMVFTMADQKLPNTAVRNAASFEVFAVGAVLIGGEIQKDDEITVTVQEEREYKYKVKENDELANVVDGLVDAINEGPEGAGDPDVLAIANRGALAIIVQAKMAGSAGNSVSLKVSTSDAAKLTASTSGATLRGGGEASKIAPGTIVTLVGDGLADEPEAAPPGEPVLPRELGGVKVYFDGIEAPLFYVSPKQINAQIPVEVFDRQSVSAYVRTTHADGTVSASNAVAVPIVQFNPGLFGQPGGDIRPAVALHSSSHATGIVLIDGSVAAGDIASIRIAGEDQDGDGEPDHGVRVYSYTVTQEDDNLANPKDENGNSAGTLATRLAAQRNIMNGLINLINEGDPEVMAEPTGQWARIILKARRPGPEFNGLEYGVEVRGKDSSTEASVILTDTTDTLCCANEAGALVTAANPALPGEIVTVYATGLGLVEPDEARDEQKTGEIYRGPVLNKAIEFVSSQVGGKTANVLNTGLVPGSVGLYQVDLQLLAGLETNPLAAATISQGFFTSNIVTIPVFNPNQDEEE